MLHRPFRPPVQITGPGSGWACIRLEAGSEADIDGLEATGIKGWSVLNASGGATLRVRNAAVRDNRTSVGISTETAGGHGRGPLLPFR